MSEEREQYGIGGRLVAADQLPSRIQSALALLKRVESGESVEVHSSTLRSLRNNIKSKGEIVRQWPGRGYFADSCVEVAEILDSLLPACKTTARNGGAGWDSGE